MKKKRILSIFLLSSLLIGCSQQKSVPAENSEPVQSEVQETEVQKEERAEEPVSEEQIPETAEQDIETVESSMTNDNLSNSVKIVDYTAKETPDSNIMFSPTSLNYALGMISEGATGETYQLLSTYLGAENYGKKAEKYLEAIQDYNFGDKRNGYSSCLEIADALWISDKYSLSDSFVETVKEEYDANATALDFSDKPGTVKTINQWVSDKTHEMIQQLVTEDMFHEDSVLCLTNTVYFEAPWNNPWTVNNREKEVFTNTDGSETEISFMYNNGSVYYENEQATAFGCNYLNGLSFIGILPKETGDFTVESLDVKSLLNSESYDFTDLYIKMPKLDFETTMNLTDALKDAGLGKMFTDDAEFPGISNIPLKVDTVLQKTKLELDENGTKASAATALMVDMCMAVADEEPVVKEVYLDRPFAFLIYDTNNDEVLFIGKVVNVQ